MRTRRARIIPRRTYRPRVLIIGRKWAKRHPMVFSDASGHRPVDIIVDDVAESTCTPGELEAMYRRLLDLRLKAPPNVYRRGS